MKILSKDVLLFLLSGLMIAACTSAYANTAPPLEQSNAYKEVGIESFQYLMDFGCDITSSSGGYVTITGYTKAYSSVDYIKVRLYLQRWDGTKWVDLGSWIFEKNNTSNVEGIKNLQVSKGYYYRTKAEHSLTKSGVNEQATSYSSSISVN